MKTRMLCLGGLLLLVLLLPAAGRAGRTVYGEPAAAWAQPQGGAATSGKMAAPLQRGALAQEGTQNRSLLTTLLRNPVWLIGIAFGLLGLFAGGIVALLVVTRIWPSEAHKPWFGCGVGAVTSLLIAAVVMALAALGTRWWAAPAMPSSPASELAMPTAAELIGSPVDTVSTRAPTATSPPTTAHPKASATAEPVATWTPQPTATEAPTETPSATPTPACPPVSGPFAAVWTGGVRQELGCRTAHAFEGVVAEEHFERGIMFWREGLDESRSPVLFNDGTWRFYHHTRFEEGSPDFSCVDANTPAQCPPTPIRGFGMMWCNIPELRQRLGNALDCERGYRATMQAFDRGFLLRNDHGTIYMLLDDGRWQRR
jgi:hypothetical protein